LLIIFLNENVSEIIDAIQKIKIAAVPYSIKSLV